MPETYKIHLMPAVGDEVAAHTLQLYQPSEAAQEIYELTAWATIVFDEAETNPLYEQLTPDPEGDPDTFYWTSALADAAKAWKIVALSAVGVGRNNEVAQPPRPSDPNTLTVYCYTIDAGIGIVADLPFIAAPVNGYAVAGDRIVVAKKEKPTNQDGYAALPLHANSGRYRLVLGDVKKEIDTTYMAGRTVNLKDLQ